MATCSECASNGLQITFAYYESSKSKKLLSEKILDCTFTFKNFFYNEQNIQNRVPFKVENESFLSPHDRIFTLEDFYNEQNIQNQVPFKVENEKFSLPHDHMIQRPMRIKG